EVRGAGQELVDVPRHYEHRPARPDVETMNITEQAGKAVTSVTDALKGTPALLVLVVFNIMLLGGILYLSVSRERHSHERFMSMIERCAPLQQPQKYKLQSDTEPHD